MPFGATELVQEGLVLPPVRLVRAGVMVDDVLAIVLANVRTPEERLGDLRAQLAACAAGREGWRALWAREGAERVRAASEALLDYASGGRGRGWPSTKGRTARPRTRSRATAWTTRWCRCAPRCA
jgi:N-methylhydantoinase B/oxoprolinase/acetone carboxylase alpha subunit